jgi:hypothetical protein
MWLGRKLSREMLRISCDKTGQARLRRACPNGCHWKAGCFDEGSRAARQSRAAGEMFNFE